MSAGNLAGGGLNIIFPGRNSHQDSKLSGISRPVVWGTRGLHPGFPWFSSFPWFP